ncbi:MAG: hypothetical protein GX652_09720 [Burkholderiaceae bacterium]|nr:hypothetical protein [Burkholderiaceae bacterium]
MARGELPLNPPGSVPLQPKLPHHIEAYDTNERDLLIAAMRIGLLTAKVAIEDQGRISILGVGVSREEPRECKGFRTITIPLSEIMGLYELALGDEAPRAPDEDDEDEQDE